jgi:hypothetical protein
MTTKEHMIKSIEKIIEALNEVKKDSECHKTAKSLATLVIRDLNRALKGKQKNDS